MGDRVKESHCTFETAPFCDGHKPLRFVRPVPVEKGAGKGRGPTKNSPRPPFSEPPKSSRFGRVRAKDGGGVVF